MSHPLLCLEASWDAPCLDSKNIVPCPSQGSSKKGEDERAVGFRELFTLGPAGDPRFVDLGFSVAWHALASLG